MSEAKQWLAYAIDDLAYGELGMESLPRAASWSLQQAAEKALKALLLAKCGEAPRTHDVAYLLSQLKASFSLPDEVTDAALLIAEITPATRYPADDLPPIEQEDAHAYFKRPNRLSIGSCVRCEALALTRRGSSPLSPQEIANITT